MTASCSRCGIEDHSAFSPSGLSRKICRKCHAENLRVWRSKNPDKMSKLNRAYRQKNGGRNARNAKMKTLFGLTLGEYEARLAEQKDVCAICQQPERAIHRSTGAPKNLAVDHCHETGMVRGLLCSACNTALGLFRDDTKLLRAAMQYLAPKEER